MSKIAVHADIQTAMNRYVHQERDRIGETGKRVTDLFEKIVQGEGIISASSGIIMI